MSLEIKNRLKGIGRTLPLVPLMFLMTQIPASAQQEVTKGNPNKGVALTFDCGPWVYSDRVNGILDALEQRGLKVTFFVTGEFIRKNPQDFERIIYSGHEIANHSDTHPDFNTLSPVAIKAEEAQWGHVDPIQAATLAKEANAKKLVLTHFSANRYTNIEQRREAEKKAQEIFPNTTAVTDDLILEIPEDH